jgi:purine catabolism regulator
VPPSLGAVLRTPRLRLRLLTGHDALDRPVRWVAVSELTDPTPYLEGGELVLTTGMRWSPDQDAAAVRDYVGALVRRGVTGLGFGIGVAHDDVPAPLVAAAEAAGLPLLEVPRATPFIAVGKEVSRLLAREEYEGLTRAFAAGRCCSPPTGRCGTPRPPTRRRAPAHSPTRCAGCARPSGASAPR